MAIRVLRVTTRLPSLRSLRGDQDVRRCGQEGAAGGIWRHPPSIPRPETGGTGWDWALSSPGWPDGEWDISIVQFGSPDQKQPPVSVKTVCGHRGHTQRAWLKWSIRTWIGACHQNVLPGAVPRHEVAPGSGPEDVQHADVLPTVLGQIFWSVWWVLIFSMPYLTSYNSYMPNCLTAQFWHNLEIERLKGSIATIFVL